MQSPCGNKVSTQNFVSGSLLSIRVSPSMTARVVFFKRYAPFLIFAHKRLCAVLFVGGTNVPHECYPRHTRRIRRCYAAIFCMMLISFRSAYRSSFYNYKAKEKDPHRIGTDQKSEMRHLKRIPVLSPHRPELQRSCKRKFASSRLLRSACFRYVPTLA